MQVLEWIAFDRIRQFEAQLHKIKSADFIRGSTKSAIEVIESAMSQILSEVSEAAQLDERQYLVQKVVSINQKLFSYTNYLGVLLRSTNVRNCYESYQALAQIVTRLTGKNDQLIISSEWDASPFFIQSPPEILKSFVFIGIPAFASRNALLLPLAAHEIGHAVWRIKEVEGTIYTTAEFILSKYVEENRSVLIPNPTLFTELDEERIVGQIMTIVMSQAQETFCDLFGAYLFKKSYYYAFEQYLVPGFGRRESNYPSFESRMKYIREAAFEGMAVEGDPIVSASINDLRLRAPPDLIAADAIAEKIHSGICKVVKEILSEASLLAYSADDEADVSVSLKSGVPPQKIVSPVVILNAVWSAYRDKLFVIDDLEKRHAFTNFMNNLCMKSLEIVKFLQLKGEPC